MGFRSTFVTTDFYPNKEYPAWFQKKYSDTLSISSCIATCAEYKTYGQLMGEIHEDLQKVIKEIGIGTQYMVWLHEDGTITKVSIQKDKILYFTPTRWKESEEGFPNE